MVLSVRLSSLPTVLPSHSSPPLPDNNDLGTALQPLPTVQSPGAALPDSFSAGSAVSLSQHRPEVVVFFNASLSRQVRGTCPGPIGLLAARGSPPPPPARSLRRCGA